MLDISFDDSECGCLKQAGINSCSNICCLDLMLDRGGIGEAEIFRERVKWKKIWYSSLLDIPAEEESERETEWAFDCLDRAVDLAKSGEEIRIWYSDRAFSKCGLYYLAWRLDGVSSRVWSVELPENFTGDGKQHTWAVLSPKDLKAKFVAYQRPLTQERRQELKEKWNGLVREKGELRIAEAGEVRTVPLDYFDAFIWGHIPDREVKAIKICVDVLTESKIWLDETFIGYRIRKMIETGRLAVRKESKFDEPFPSWLRNIYVKKTV